MWLRRYKTTTNTTSADMHLQVSERKFCWVFFFSIFWMSRHLIHRLFVVLLTWSPRAASWGSRGCRSDCWTFRQCFLKRTFWLTHKEKMIFDFERFRLMTKEYLFSKYLVLSELKKLLLEMTYFNCFFLSWIPSSCLLPRSSSLVRWPRLLPPLSHTPCRPLSPFLGWVPGLTCPQRQNFGRVFFTLLKSQVMF